ncbi:MAG TPA: transposase [Bryobacteraceae bacterium]|nr:transposase [Bryobacteraceae bacterium]
MARAVLVGTPHHLTQRGLDQRQVFFDDSDHQVYLSLVRINAKRFGADLLGYCLMPNHVHWIVTPQAPRSLARTFGEAHGRYAAYTNAKHTRSGHFWQNRFFSCPLDRSHLWTALRYVERNPVRAGLVDHATSFLWSSAAAHTGIQSPPAWLHQEPMRSTFSAEQWEIYLKSESIGEAELLVRTNTYTGRPAGSREFTEWAESVLGRKLTAQAGGRRPKISAAVATKALPAQAGMFEFD